jgi:undecaprenyl diphosphate synthase
MLDVIKIKSKDNKKISVHFALCYDGSQEILDAAQGIIDHGIKKVNKDNFEKELYGKGKIPDLDLVIRTGGEHRISGFLLWQSRYAELRFIDPYWPEYTPSTFLEDIEWFSNRERRFGK